MTERWLIEMQPHKYSQKAGTRIIKPSEGRRLIKSGHARLVKRIVAPPRDKMLRGATFRKGRYNANRSGS